MGTVHVVPLYDQQQHQVPGGLAPVPWWRRLLRRRCWQMVEAIGPDHQACACTPSTEMVPNDHGPDGWLITHHSFDGREHSE